MSIRLSRLSGILFIVTAGVANISGQSGAQKPASFDAHRPPIALRAEWKRAPQQVPQRLLAQGDLIDQNVELTLHGGHRPEGPTTCPPTGMSSCPYGLGILWVQRAETEPVYAWTGLCETTCAVTLRHKNHDIDLTGPLAHIRWRALQAGYHLLRPIIKLANGQWLAGDFTQGYTADWRESDMTIADLRWRTFDITKVTEGREGDWVKDPDLSRVEAVGFTDMMPGSDHGRGGSSRVAWLEVYGKPVPRTAALAK